MFLDVILKLVAITLFELSQQANIPTEKVRDYFGNTYFTFYGPFSSRSVVRLLDITP
jgi:hypothetical protein